MLQMQHWGEEEALRQPYSTRTMLPIRLAGVLSGVPALRLPCLSPQLRLGRQLALPPAKAVAEGGGDSPLHSALGQLCPSPRDLLSLSFLHSLPTSRVCRAPWQQAGAIGRSPKGSPTGANGPGPFTTIKSK